MRSTGGSLLRLYANLDALETEYRNPAQSMLRREQSG